MPRNLLQANLYPITYRWSDDKQGTELISNLGVLKESFYDDEEWKDEFFGSNTDNRVFFWFNTDEEVLELQPGDEIEDGAIIVSIDKTPEYAEEVLHV